MREAKRREKTGHRWRRESGQEGNGRNEDTKHQEEGERGRPKERQIKEKENIKKK